MLIVSAPCPLSVCFHFLWRKKKWKEEDEKKKEEENEKEKKETEEGKEERVVSMSISGKCFHLPMSLEAKSGGVASVHLWKIALKIPILESHCSHMISHVILLCSPILSLNSPMQFALANRTILTHYCCLFLY
jgi:hypothetical protein